MTCPNCHGEGFITVNTSWAKTAPDPQLDRDERCPDCHGTGEVWMPATIEEFFAEWGWR